MGCGALRGVGGLVVEALCLGVVGWACGLWAWVFMAVMLLALVICAVRVELIGSLVFVVRCCMGSWCRAVGSSVRWGSALGAWGMAWGTWCWCLMWCSGLVGC